jgi:hypothetical protein
MKRYFQFALKTALAASLLGSLALTISFASPAVSGITPPDVPANHPAASAVQGMIKKAIMKPGADGKFHGEQPVTRYELAVVIDRVVTSIEASRKPLKQGQFPVSSKEITAPQDHWAHKAQIRLASEGFASAKSPLFIAPGTAPITAKELAVVISEMTSRLSDRSLPPTKDALPVD